MTAETFQFFHTPVGNVSYALGWNIDNSQSWSEGPVINHAGSNRRWWAIVGLVPGLNVGIFIVTNAANDAASDATDELGLLLVQRMLNSQ